MRIYFVGDVMLGRLVNEVLKKEPLEYPWGDTLPILKRASVRICNLECVISDKGEKLTKTFKPFHFRSDKKNVGVLTAAGMKAVSVANNHVLDYGEEAMMEMFEVLSRAGINYAGAGKDIREAMRPAIFDEGGEKFGFLAFTDNEPVWEADEKKTGIYFLSVEGGEALWGQLLSEVKKLRNKVDWVIVSAHWGGNWGYVPPKEHVDLAHALIEAGADIIFGHSAHVCRGVEVYQGKVIIYSAGDFVDDYAVDEMERNDRSAIFGIEGEKGKIAAVYFYPTVIANFQAKMARREALVEIRQKMGLLCRDLGTETRWNDTRGRLEVILE